MSHSPLEKAHSLLQRRKFSHAISLLESGNNPEFYRESFDYFLTAGIACLYLGDTGTACFYFQRARHIRMTDPTLLCAQAVIFLMRGYTDKAINYYVDVLDYDPNNKVALAAMEFIRTHGTYEEVCKAVYAGEIKRFYPPLGINPDVVKRIALSALAGVVLAFLIFNLGNFSRAVRGIHLPVSGKRADLTSLFLSVDEMGNARKQDLTGGVYKYILTDSQIKKSYDLAMSNFQNYRENASQVEINRLLNSNASDAIKEKAKMISSYFKEPTFDTLVDYNDNIEYADVAKDPELYLGCMVAWSGRVSNAFSEGASYRCDLLVGYENMERVEGFVPLFFEVAPYPAIDGERPVKVLGKIKVENGKIVLDGRAVYQPVKRGS
jgi:tetratricopeptide (TPR) repeat protein